ENTRSVWSIRWIEDVGQDVRYALRTLRAYKGFTVAAVLSLAVGLGANASVFQVINALVFHSLEVDHPEELFFVESAAQSSRSGPDGPRLSRFSFPAYQQFTEAAPSARFGAMTYPSTMQVAVNGSAELRMAQLISGNWFAL